MCLFCCTQKRDLLKNDNFEKTIDIFPRIIIFKKLKIFEVNCQTITVRNTGTFCRKVKFITEPNNDITFKINGNTNLQPGAYVSVDIFIEPTKKKLCNRNRYFFVLAEHPDIVWEIPLIVLKKEHEIYIPELICLPKVPANTLSYYQFLVYNPQGTEIAFSICSNYESLTIKPISETIPADDYYKILIVGKVPSEPITTSILLTLKNGKSFKIFVQMESSKQSIHLSTSELKFEDTYIGLKSQKNLIICNRSNECVSFQWAKGEIVEYTEKDDGKDEKLVVSEFITIRNKRGCIPAMNSILSILSFTPPINFRYCEEESQLQINEVVYLYCPFSNPQSYRYRVHISGRILGPNIEITPMEIDIGNLYMGQIHCGSLDVLNKGPIPGEIYFKDHTDKTETNFAVTPSSTYIKPDATKSIQLSFYRRDVGKFLTKLTFKIKSGDFILILLRGVSLPTKVNVFPEIFEFGNIPICIPQKGSVEIYNPLPVSIVVEPKIVDDGLENPLILCVDSLNLPLNTRIATYYNTSLSHGRLGEEDLKNIYLDFSSNSENSSRTNTCSQISSLFQNNVLDDIPTMATELLQNFKIIHCEDQLEAGMRMIDASLDCIFDRCNYFQELKENRNYLRLNWKALPCDAKEIAIEEERFYLESNETKIFPVVLVPNSSGPSTKSIEFKVYPLGINNSDIKDTLNSTYMVNTLRLQYNCIVPILEYNNDISFSQPLYVDMENTFSMTFKNIDVVPGFVYFKVIPISKPGKIKVGKNKQKFFIGPGEQIEVPCSVIFQSVGQICLHGIFQLVGKLLEYSFKVEAKVIPPEIYISTDRIFEKQEVLELTRTKIFITNISPTVAQVTFSLKNETHEFLEPKGGSLAPNQKILLSIFSKFLDPGLYKNSLCIHLKHSKNLIIPITFSVEGAPLKFEPNIKLGLDFGTIFRKPANQEHIVKITNLGGKSYKINFQKKYSKKTQILPISVFNIEPNILTLARDAQEIVKIKLDISKEITYEEEFCVDGMDEKKHRFKLFTFVTKCNVVETKVLWSKNEIRFEIKNPQLNEKKAFDVVNLINTTPFVANVNLNVQGNFILGENYAGLSEKSLDFKMDGKTSKEIYVSLDEREIEAPYLICQCFKGVIKCKANNKIQKSLPLHVKTESPSLRICTPKVTLFPPYTDSFAHISIHNCSPINAKFIWKEVESLILDKPLTEPHNEELYSKTISEIILSMPKENVPKFPNSIKFQYPEVFSPDAESLDEETPRDKSSPIMDAIELKQKLSLSSSRTETFTSSSTSLNSESTLIQPISCQPLPPSTIEMQTIGIDEIFDYLGLSEKTSLEEPSSTNYEDYDSISYDTNYKKKDDFEETNKIVFQHKSGQILPNSIYKAYMFLPTLPKDKNLVSKYKLEVFGGQIEFLDITVTSQKGRIQVSRTDINLWKNIWYKIIVEKIRVTNISQYATKITIVENKKLTLEKNCLALGYVEITSPKQFILAPKTSTDIELQVSLGLHPRFSESIGLEINNNTTAIPIHIHGTALIPMIIPIKLNRIPQTSNDDITASYFYLRDLFNDMQRKYIQDELNTLPEELYETTQKNKFKRNQTRNFIFLNYNSTKNYPEAEEIEQIIETQRFISNVSKSNELKTRYDKFYNKCMHLHAMEFEPVINLKITICCPIPWEFPAFSLDMNELILNETKTFEMEMVFVGPARLFLSLRTSIALPGLIASFEAPQKFSQMFVFFHQSPDAKNLKRYTNMRERSSDIEKNNTEDSEVAIHHSHSYDIDEAGVHQRNKLSNEIKQIKEHYTKMSKPMKEKKNPLVLTEICQTTDENLSDFRLKLTFKLTATNKFYEIDQIIEDYMFIDIHLGPTIPILLRGKIVSANK